MAQISVGLAGPILTNGSNAQGDFFVPLATNEGALIAFYTRGMKACCLVEESLMFVFQREYNAVTFLGSIQFMKHNSLFIGFRRKQAHFLRSYLKRVDTRN